MLGVMVGFHDEPLAPIVISPITDAVVVVVRDNPDV
jgi:hypothetical protein